MSLVNKNKVFCFSLIFFIHLSFIFHFAIPSEFRDRGTKIDLISFLLFSFFLFIKIIYINWKIDNYFRPKIWELFVYPIIILFLFSYILFFIYLVKHNLAILIVVCLYLYIFIETIINFKKFINYANTGDQLLNFFFISFIGFFYILVVHLFETIGDRNIEWITANRWIELPIDNEIPRRFADKLYNGLDPRGFLSVLDWSSSDRPPLMTGFILFFRPVFEFLQIPSESSAYAAGIGFHLIWIPILLNILRSLKISLLFSVIILLGFVFNGFIFYNTVFVWPKLGAGALLIYAFFIYNRVGLLEIKNTIIIAILSSLAWLSHGGVSISIVPILLIVLARPKFYKIKYLIISASVVAILCLPWTAYQKLYDPPGDRLLKWHIGGQPNAIEKSLTETIHESYSNITFDQWIENRKLNFMRLFGDHFLYLSSFHPSSSQRIVNDFFFFFRSQEIIILLSLFLTIYLLFKKRFKYLVSDLYKGRLYLILLFLSLIFWVFLLFMPKSTVIHQGSYLNNLILMITLYIFLYKYSKLLLILNTLTNTIYFSTTYLPKSNLDFGNINYFSLFNLISLVLILLTLGITFLVNITNRVKLKSNE